MKNKRPPHQALGLALALRLGISFLPVGLVMLLRWLGASSGVALIGAFAVTVVAIFAARYYFYGDLQITRKEPTRQAFDPADQLAERIAEQEQK